MVRSCCFILLLALGLAGCVDKSRDLASAPAGTSGTTPTNSSSGSTTTTEPSGEGFDRLALMTNLADNIFIPNYQSSADLAETFSNDSGALATYCGSIGSAEEAADYEAAKSGWLSLMDAVQKTELHVVGPALRNDEALHNRVHSYSVGALASCGLDQAVIAAAKDDYQIANRAFNQRGMGAIEYLLFNQNLKHSCSSQIEVTATWNDLSETDRKTQRCELALTLAKDVSLASDLILDQWTEGDTAYRSEFLAEENLGDNVQMVSDGLFYVETFTKSHKLMIPLGLDDKCSSLTCPGLLESPYSENTLRNIRTNSAEFLRIFNGESGLGFDDLIVDEDFAEIAERFQTQLAEVDDKLALMSETLEDQVALVDADASDPTCVNGFANPDTENSIPACSLAGLLKRVTDDLKIEFVTIVGVALPGRVQSDND